jgi:sigma-B regulation protein RsbU (phosphoserine phosphatase)
MRVLIADDDEVSLGLIEHSLGEWGYEVIAVADGAAAWAVLDGPEAPLLAILDWLMPGMDGVEVCARVRARATPDSPCSPYLVLLTIKSGKSDVVAGLEAGADDYLSKPFDRDELRARIQAGRRIVELQQSLAARVTELGDALAQVKHLRGLLPICSYCKKIRNDTNYWQQIEAYITEHSDAKFSHSICPECYPKVLHEIRGGHP